MSLSVILHVSVLFDNIYLKYNFRKICKFYKIVYNALRMITQNFSSSLSLFLYQPRVSQRSESLAVFFLLKIISRYITRGFEVIRLTRLDSAVINIEALIVCNYIFLLFLTVRLIFFVHWIFNVV